MIGALSRTTEKISMRAKKNKQRNSRIEHNLNFDITLEMDDAVKIV